MISKKKDNVGKRSNYEERLKVEGSFLDIIQASVKDAEKTSAKKKAAKKKAKE
jgi:hypothetical protein